MNETQGEFSLIVRNDNKPAKLARRTFEEKQKDINLNIVEEPYYPPRIRIETIDPRINRFARIMTGRDDCGRTIWLYEDGAKIFDLRELERIHKQIFPELNEKEAVRDAMEKEIALWQTFNPKSIILEIKRRYGILLSEAEKEDLRKKDEAIKRNVRKQQSRTQAR